METQNNKNDQDAKIENGAEDQGIESSTGQPLKTRDDKRVHDIDANMSISEMREEEQKGKTGKLKDQIASEENGKADDAMNYKNDRENGSYNPKNI
jgi:hypothetical protein